jgi:leader peptidase (prepilin peptidase) / N-methyltransferase
MFALLQESYFIPLLITFIFGTFLGSFLNLVADRIINGGSILFGHSRCDGCGMPLKAQNLVPVLSYIFQRGKCSNCNDKLPLTYPISELLAGLAVAFSFHRSGFIQHLGNNNVETLSILVYLLIIFSFYIILFMTDLKYQLIPNVIVYSGIVVAAGFILITQLYGLRVFHQTLVSSEMGRLLVQNGLMQVAYRHFFRFLLWLLLTSFLLMLFFKFLVFITKGRGMGRGDVKLALLIGLFNGFPLSVPLAIEGLEHPLLYSFQYFTLEHVLQNVLAIFLGFIFGAAYSLVLMGFGKKGMKDTIAFGPFLIIGSVVAFVWGAQIIDFYLSLSLG